MKFLIVLGTDWYLAGRLSQRFSTLPWPCAQLLAVSNFQFSILKIFNCEQKLKPEQKFISQLEKEASTEMNVATSAGFQASEKMFCRNLWSCFLHLSLDDCSSREWIEGAPFLVYRGAKNIFHTIHPDIHIKSTWAPVEGSNPFRITREFGENLVKIWWRIRHQIWWFT